MLALIHGDDVHPGVFREPIGNHGHLLEEWSTAWGRPLPRPLDDYDAVFVFGGAMHADQDARHPWLREETLLLQGLLDRGVPLLGVCLGAQMIARAAHAAVYPAPKPEIGWFDVCLTGAADDDPVLAGLPQRFEAFQWHSYTYDLPAGAVELARSPVCTQAYRLGRHVWGVQFHPEVTSEQVESWIADPDEPPPNADELRATTAERIEAWNETGRRICSAFLRAVA